MAQARRKSKPRAKRTSSKAPARPAARTTKPPRRREIAGIVCFLLGVFSFIGYFDAEPIFIGFLTGFVKRLIGYGYYALPPALIMCSVILVFHKGRPVIFRTICTLLLTVVTGAIMHLFTSNIDYVFSFSMVGLLWRYGAALESGGAISGTISELFYLLLGTVATAIALIIAAALLVLVSFNATIFGLIEAFNRREKREYEYKPEPEPIPAHPFEPERPQYRERDRRPYRRASTPLWKRKKIDIPIDEHGRPPVPDHFANDDNDNGNGNFYDKNPRVPPPDQVVKKTAFDDIPDQSKSDVGSGNDEPSIPEDMPLDIPFMDGRIRRPLPLIPPIVAEKFETANEPVFTSNEPTFTPSEYSFPPKPKKRTLPIVPMPVDPDIKYMFPPLDLLSRGDPQTRAGESEVRQNTERLESAFQSFGVSVIISNATRGPSVTRYEAGLEAGVKLNRLTSLADDIALSLGTTGVRIAAMPNRISTVGIEVPNKSISKVHLRDVIESQEFSTAPSKLTFAIGKDISGESIVGDVPKLPHMLVAGTTGSGKSVCLNSIILSILYKATPEDVRFIMIDPKMVEFRVYNDIPHLLVPVVTDVKKAAGALQWATFEMMKRYSLFAEVNARDIGGYNQVARKAKEDREPLPQIIVVIDELADLMMMAAKEVEESVCRIAQMGRAAGIHLIIATQSPRANVITGLMKANIPSRIAFKVASALESQIILDPGQNADKLVGNGDMLYSPTGSGKPMRLQGTWVSDKEREKVIDYIKKSGETQYSEEVIGEIEKAAVEKSGGGKSSIESGGSDHDELLPQAVDVILETKQASVSMLQRRLKLGYARAARIVDQMEEMGIVGPFEGSKPRPLLIDREQWLQIQHIHGITPSETPFIDPVISVSEDDTEDDY